MHFLFAHVFCFAGNEPTKTEWVADHSGVMDFGDTLCDERFIWSSGPEWMEVYETFDYDGIGAQWCLGEIDTPQFPEVLSESMNWSAESIAAHMNKCCERIQFFDQTSEFFKSRHLPQAIVTVNPGIFSDVIVPICDFQSDCEKLRDRTLNPKALNNASNDSLG